MRFFTLITLATLLLGSCAPSSNYFQLLKTETTESIEIKDDLLLYEDDNLSITYNFWADHGDGTFYIFNKTEKAMYLDMTESFLIVNGTANPYYKNRAVTTTASGAAIIGSSYTRGTATTVGNTPGAVVLGSSRYAGSTVVASESSSVTYYESELVLIPVQSGRFITGFKLSEYLFRDCDLLRFPKKENDINTIKYTQETSPLKLENRIAYRFDKDDEKGNNVVVNYFWVNEVTNYHEKHFTYYAMPEYCDEKSIINSKYYKYEQPGNFYIKYNGSSSTGFKH
jgi:hypothetical protein